MIRQESGQELTDLGNPVRPKLAVIYHEAESGLAVLLRCAQSYRHILWWF